MTESEIDVVLEEPGRMIVRFIGEHDLTTRGETDKLLQRLVADNEHVTADLSDATFIDSSLLHVLVNADQSARARGTRFRVKLGASPTIENTLRITGLIDSLDCFSEDEQTLPAPPLPEDFTQAISA